MGSEMSTVEIKALDFVVAIEVRHMRRPDVLAY